jgi:hypothetical protein
MAGLSIVGVETRSTAFVPCLEVASSTRICCCLEANSSHT